MKLERDEVSEAVVGNRIILQFGEHMLSEDGQNVNKHEHIRQNLRDVARLVLEAQKSTPVKSLEDFFNPSNFLHVLSAVRAVAGFDPRKKTFARPLLAHDLGHHLQTICSIVMRNAVKSCDNEVIKSCKNFLTLYCKKWNRVVGQRFRANVSKSKKYEAVVGDVKRPRHATETVHRRDENKLMTCDDSDMESGGTQHKPKPKSKWSEAEVHAVEKHLMRLIKKHKLPQKDDCVRCLEAEPHALRNRTWKGVKDYVRNRITTLQRQSGSGKDPSKPSVRRRQEEPQQSSGTNFVPNAAPQDRPLTPQSLNSESHYGLDPNCYPVL
ncbi:uncharacterized protein LOC106512654, partial [Austrofundulus limnaeus]|uniref:Uncharacterized protein LOC106512654 n=1 Tax=Austrofundulus limnaeus TaxID=52670 RepID=A0A2I4AMG7_AUSLI